MFVAGLHILGLELPDTLAVTGLFLAVVGGHTSIVKCLVEQPAIQVNQVEGTLGVPLVDAVKNSFTEIAEALMTHSSIVVDEPNIKGETALMYAAEKNDTKLVENLLQASYVDASRECAAEATALVRACAAGAVDTASILLSRPDIKVNHVDKEGRSALSIATSTGDQDLLKLILNHPNVDVPDELGRTELMKACAKGAVDQVDKLLQRSNVSVNSVNFLSSTHNGYTPLMYACEAGHIDVVRRLLKEPKLRLTYKTTKKESALVVASQNGHDAIVQLLLEHSQTYDEDDLDLSLFWACRNGYPNVVNILMKTSVDVNKFTDALGGDDVSWRHSARLFRKGTTPLDVACRRNHPDVVGLLLTHDKISVNVTDDEGFTPLMTSCAKGYDEVAKMLLRHRSLRVNKRGAAGDTALGIAVQSGYPSIVHLLLQHPEIDVNIKDEIGNTPIILSITTGDVAIVQELLQHPKIDLKVKNKALLTAMDMASALGNAEIQRLVRAKYRELKKNRSREHKEADIKCLRPSAFNPSQDAVEDHATAGEVDAFEETDGAAPVVEYLNHLESSTDQSSQTNPNFETEGGMTPLIFACISNMPAMIRRLLQMPEIAINYKNKGFCLACRQGHVQMVEFLLDCPDVDSTYLYKTPDDEELSGLALACAHGRFSVVQTLLKHIKNHNIDEELILGGLVMACRMGHHDIAALLLDEGNPTTDHLNHGFHEACTAGHASIVDLLLQNPQVDVNFGVPLNDDDIEEMEMFPVRHR
ncbi:unnamed protein product [Aphanomyces euteiches]